MWGRPGLRWRTGGTMGMVHAGSKYLNNAIQKYGKDKFIYEILDFAFTQSQADCLEINCINKYDSQNPEKGYNIKNGGSSGKHSLETRKYLSQIRRGTKLGDENTFFGKSHTDETKQKISKTKRTFTDQIELQILQEYNLGNTSMQKLASKYDVSVKVIFNIINRGQDGRIHKGRGYQHDPRSGRFQRIKS